MARPAEAFARAEGIAARDTGDAELGRFWDRASPTNFISCTGSIAGGRGRVRMRLAVGEGG